MNLAACWIWHPALADQANCYVHFRHVLHLPDPPPVDAAAFVTAGLHYRLWINGAEVGRGPNPSAPSRTYVDVHDVTRHLRPGRNVLAALVHCQSPTPNAILRQNAVRGGFLLELRAPGRTGAALAVTGPAWRCRPADAWDFAAPVNCTLLGDYKETLDTRREPVGWREDGFDDAAWDAPEVLGPALTAPWTELVEREIPFLGGETVHPVAASWRSASVTYAWRDDWEVYDEQSLVPDSPHGRRPGRPARIRQTHTDFDPSIVLDFGRLVTGYVTIDIAASAGGVIDVLYGETLSLVRIDRLTLRGGPQTIQPFGRRTFRYLELLFRSTPEPIEVAGVSLAMDTYPVEPRGAFACSDPLLDRIWEVGASTMRLSMLDHFVDCPGRERTIYGGDVYAENLIAHHAFGDPRLNAKTLRQMFHLQFPEGALPPWGPWADCPSFYPSWSAFTGLAFLDHHDLTGDRAFLDELWPAFRRLLGFFADQAAAHPLGLIGHATERHDFRAWLAANKPTCQPYANLPAWVLLHRAAILAATTGRTDDAARARTAADALAAAIRRHLLDPDTGAVREIGPEGPRRRHQSGQYDQGLLLWSGLDPAGAPRATRLALDPATDRLTSPFHALFLAAGLFAQADPHDQGRTALDYVRAYWGDLLRRGATTFWEHFSSDWPALSGPPRGMSLNHGWSAAPTWLLPARVLGVRPSAPGFASVLVAPQPADLAWARGRVPTPHGTVDVSWRRHAQRFEIDLTLPPTTTALLRLPPSLHPHPRLTLDGVRMANPREALLPPGHHTAVQETG